jgi:7-cyano-7-deazaguanine synthase in queuosine biosynthesis
MASNLYLRAPGEKRPPPPGPDAVLHLNEAGVPGLPIHHHLELLPAGPAAFSPGGQAFLLMAAGVRAADKFVPRAAAPDAWTREIILDLPATTEWAGLAPKFANLLNFLTGDAWKLKFRAVPLHPVGQAPWPYAWRPTAAALFSGGLDSLVGAIDGLEAGERLLLVSHYDFGQLASTQQALALALKRRYGPDRVEHLGLRVQFPRARESTLRSRSLLFLALGLAAAQAFAPDLPLIIPENGWISLNAPLTLNRLGPYSTRTTHPFFLKGLTALWREAEINHPLTNPYRTLTKGEMLARCHNPALLKELYPLTVSCARPEAARWRGVKGGPCGYCYPCLMRRAALHRGGRDRGADYLLDVFADPETLRHRVQGGDLRALLFAWKTWEEAPEEIMARLYFPESAAAAGFDYAAARGLLARGFEEIGQFIRDKGNQGIKAYLG